MNLTTKTKIFMRMFLTIAKETLAKLLIIQPQLQNILQKI